MNGSFVRRFAKVISDNSPTLLTGLSVAGLVTTTVLAVKATPKAFDLISDLKRDQVQNITEEQVEELHRNGEVDLNPVTKIDIVKVTWKCYIPSAIMGGITIACLIGANSINLRRNATLASVYSLTEATLKEYQAKVIETIGENKEQKVRDEIAKDHITKNPPNTSQIIFTGKGETLCYDAYSGRYFKCDIDTVKKIQNELNRKLIDENDISLNEAYYELGLDNVKMGEDLGWTVDQGLIDFKFSSQLTPDGTPCLVIDYTIEPLFDYSSRR